MLMRQQGARPRRRVATQDAAWLRNSHLLLQLQPWAPLLRGSAPLVACFVGLVTAADCVSNPVGFRGVHAAVVADESFAHTSSISTTAHAAVQPHPFTLHLPALVPPSCACACARWRPLF